MILSSNVKARDKNRQTRRTWTFLPQSLNAETKDSTSHAKRGFDSSFTWDRSAILTLGNARQFSPPLTHHTDKQSVSVCVSRGRDRTSDMRLNFACPILMFSSMFPETSKQTAFRNHLS